MRPSDFKFDPDILVLVATDGNSDTLAMTNSIREAGLSCVCFLNFHTMDDHWRLLKPSIVIVDASAAAAFFGRFWQNEVFHIVPIIQIVSPDVDGRTNALDAGATDCIITPIAIEELLARLRTHLQLRATQKQLERTNIQFATTLDKIGQGVCFFDADQRLILSNHRYAEVYGIAPDAIRPGMTLSEIAELRYAAGTGPIVSHQHYLDWCDTINSNPSPQNWSAELASGKVIRVHHERTLDGGWVSTHEDVTEHRDAERQIAHLALHDPLTDLPNRAALKGKLDALLEQHGAEGSPFTVLCLDLDRFKEVNDLFGHNAGDLLLCTTASRLRAVANGAFVARLGGDEFMVLAELDANGASALADRIITSLGEDADADGTRISMGASIGVAMFPADGNAAAALMNNADAALYRAKAEGRGTARFFEPQMDQWLREKRALQRDLHAAVSQRQLAVFYQPQADIGGDIVGFEALLRWNHPARGNIPPSVFIPIAEESSLILELGEWVLRAACKEAASWPRKLQIAVNLSPIQFKHGDLSDLVRSTLAETGLSPDRLELEITEGVLIDDFERAMTTLRQLKAIGVRIAMDDFGTGYSSLSYLQSFPFDKIKIDQSFIRNVGQSQSAAIIRAVISLGRGLDLPVIAEGVESEHQLAFLTQECCDQVQGYLVGRPRPIADYAAYLGRERPETVELRPARTASRSPQPHRPQPGQTSSELS
ncbi:putative bifunctional diguanylate cyclase/phosphodiesterase [Rhizobium rhizogenes]|uniref:putative bifunctional diguanylate cyclase/phosphodiesterase n=1 Tax=Rhizobium rhizogenes TaxID=359 RepID=UPI001F41DE1C|nr:EAL domain-containing protein [Rhizobium rhizogenes]